VAAYSPQTKSFGSRTSPRSELNQNPLASPSAADSHVSSVAGADSNPPSARESPKPKYVATRTLPVLIGRNSQRSGMWVAVRAISAARSLVRLAQMASVAHRREYRPICSFVA
jgi:hypothetical protein